MVEYVLGVGNYILHTMNVIERVALLMWYGSWNTKDC